MSYHIPSDEIIIKAIQKVLKKSHYIQSQSLFKYLVVKELHKIDKKYGLSVQRLRKLALNTPEVSIDIHSREGDPKKMLKGCPVCDHSLKKVKNLTIWGGVVTIEYQCPNCGYWTGKKRRIPTRYVFTYKQ
jgi:hypothetical protein